jgi:hypothetical protein
MEKVPSWMEKGKREMQWKMGGMVNGADGWWKRMTAERNRRRAAATRLWIEG